MDASKLAAAIGREYEPPHARMKPTFRTVGDTSVLDFPSEQVTVEVSRLDPQRSETFGVIRVLSALPGTPPMLHQGRFNLTSTQSRQTLVKYLQSRESATDWAEVLEHVCMRVLEAMREGQPVVRIADVPKREAARFRVDPLVVEGFPTIIFGPGGSGKSQLAALLAMGVHGGEEELERFTQLKARGGPVMVCDWELDAETYKEMCEPIAFGIGLAEVPNFHYRQCISPLVEEAAAIGRYIDREGIELVIVDSLGYAIGGDKSSQELTMRMFAAIRAWKRTVLCVDHITNDEATGNRPYGSAYTVNSARSLWRVRSAQEEGSNELSIGLFQTKANFGKQPPVGFKLQFDDGAVFVEREDVRDVAAFQENVSLSSRIKAALSNATKALTKDEIVDALGLTDKADALTIKQVGPRLSEMVKNRHIVRIPDPTQSAARYALVSTRAEA